MTSPPPRERPAPDDQDGPNATRIEGTNLAADGSSPDPAAPLVDHIAKLHAANPDDPRIRETVLFAAGVYGQLSARDEITAAIIQANDGKPPRAQEIAAAQRTYTDRRGREYADLIDAARNAADIPAALHPGGTFIHDEPDGIETLWGAGNDVLMAAGEALIVCGPQGTGKTTLATAVVCAAIADTPTTILGLPVRSARRVLYLAMDRPRQAARAMRRQLGAYSRGHLDDRLVVWKGPPPHDLARHTGLLANMADTAGADLVIVDSLKDAALGLSDDEVGAGWNRARQSLLTAGRNLIELHHIRKIPADRKPDITDVYGSTWITSGAGSVILLNGNPGDPLIRLHHVKQPANELGPWTLLHDQATGTMRIHDETDLVAAAAANDGITVKDAARLLFETERPDRNQTEKARRRLLALVGDGRLWSSNASGPKAPARFYPSDRLQVFP